MKCDPMKKYDTMKRIRLGQPWDALFGGGLVPGSVMLLCGLPGVGKSTLAMQLAAMAAGRRKAVYFNDGGRHTFELAKRLRMTARLALVPENNVWIPTDWRGGAMVLDTLPIIARSGDQVKCIIGARRWAIRCDAPVIAVTSMTKRGDIAGSHELPHMADVVVIIEPPKRRDAGRSGDERKVEVWKHRFGTNDIPLWLRMTARGLVPAPRQVGEQSSRV